LLLLALLLPSMTSCGSVPRADDFIETEYAGSTLYVYNWGEYISDGSDESLDVIRRFEELYGIEVRYDYYSTNEELYAQLSSGASYDVIFPSDYMIERLRKEEMLQPLDFANIPNYRYIDGRYKGQFFDPEDLYTVPYSVGMIGIVYNKTMVSEVDRADPSTMTWDLLWSDAYSAAEKINFNNPRDAFGVAMLSLGLDINTTDAADWQAAYDKLSRQECIYLMDEIYNKMENGAAAMAAYYAGDCLSMMQVNEDLDFFYPSEGTNIFIDSMCIPTSAKNKGAAELFINFMLEPDVATANANYICYASPNTAVLTHPDYDYAVGTDYYDILYTLPESYEGRADATQYYHFLDDTTQRTLNRLWAQLGVDPGESGNYVGTYIFMGVVVLLLVGGSGYMIYDAVKRSKLEKLRRQKKKTRHI
jgi:spermidine/putrescine transport system substrate-binding protein